MSEISQDIGVVIVTYNRIEKLKVALSAYEKQSCGPKYIIVVNNNSDDGTKDYLDNWKKKLEIYNKHVVHLDENTGASGGFYEGLQKAEGLDADWIWVADDDAYPNADALEIANNQLKNRNIDFNGVSAMCGAVINNGNIDVDHRRRILYNGLQIKEQNVDLVEYEKDFFELTLFSYVGVIINKTCLKKVGLTKREYFIYYDDTEHSMRLSKIGKIICFPKIRIVHDQDLNSAKTFSWKAYYGLRNKLDFYKRYFPRGYAINLQKERIKCYRRILFRHRVREAEVFLDAINDARDGNLGKHSKYKPGWHLKE